jgi:multidrug efflux pump
MIVGGLLRVSVLVLFFYVGMLGLTVWGFRTTASGFIPSQDMGYLLINVQLPDSASTERTQEAMNKVETLAKQVPGVKHSQTMTGMSLLLSANGSNFGSMFLMLDSFENRLAIEHDAALRLAEIERKKKTLSEDELKAKQKEIEALTKYYTDRSDLSGESTQAKLRGVFTRLVPEAVMTVLGPPPVRGVGRAGGFKYMVEDRGDNGSQLLQAETESFVRKAAEQANPVVLNRADLPEDAVAQNKMLLKVLEVDHPVFKSLVLMDDPDARLAALLPVIQKEFKALRPSEMPKNLADCNKLFVKTISGDHPAFATLVSVFRANIPKLYFDVNRTEVMTKGVAMADLFDSLRIYLGSLYVNDINLFGRTWRVTVQAGQSYRNGVDDVPRLKVRNIEGNMVPLGSLAEVKTQPGPQILIRYNMYPAAPINGAAGVGVSSGQAIDMINGLADSELIRSMAGEWTELAFLEIQAGSTAMQIFGFAVVMVFLVLAAQYESWSLPLAIILVVPMCLLSALVGVWVAKQDINIFTQIGFVVLVGLASKNAILIVEFAKQRREEGETPRQAAIDACLLRLRPIVMTSLAFILGVLPLIVSHGAGAEMRRTLGTTVFSGMLGVTVFGLVLTPVFFFVIDVLGETSFFRSPLVRALSSVTLNLISFRYVRDAARTLQRRSSPSKTPPPPSRVPDVEPEPAQEVELVEQK